MFFNVFRNETVAKKNLYVDVVLKMKLDKKTEEIFCSSLKSSSGEILI